MPIFVQIIHKWNSTDIIGQGAYGTVYRGNQRSTNRTVAIKRIPYADSTPEGGVPCNVIREISLLRELTHTNVVQLLDVIQATPGGLYLVFEYVAHDLKTFMDQRQRSEDIRERVGLPKAMVRSFMRQILNGVGYCHTHRVLHRDLKPHNVSYCVLNVLCYNMLCLFWYGEKVCFADEYKANQGNLIEKKDWIFKFCQSGVFTDSTHQKPEWIGYNYKVVYKVVSLTGGLWEGRELSCLSF